MRFFQIRSRNRKLAKMRKLLKNNNFSCIANNCNGGVLVHELGIRFNSQFVNLFLNSHDYIKYLKSFDYYNGCQLTFLENIETPYPVAKLDDLTIHFVHYQNNEEALLKWEERKSRIDKNNLFIIFTEQEDCTKRHLEEFDSLPFENKVVFTYKKYSDLGSSVYVKEYKKNPKGVHMFFEYKNRISGKRHYDVFDFVSWFNGEKDLTKLLRK